MSVAELAYVNTSLGELTLRRRVEPRLNGLEVFEVKLGDEFLMSSLFTESEVQLARLGLAPLIGELDVVVGGLGLGFTAVEALKNPKVSRLLVVELFQEVVDWHLDGVVPNGSILADDPRCELRQGDFFALARAGFDVTDPGRRFDAVLLDIDHSPRHHLSPDNTSFYSADGLAAVRAQIKPGGTFALWSDDDADAAFTETLRTVFGAARAHNIEFPNPYTLKTSVNAVYVAQNDRVQSL